MPSGVLLPLPTPPPWNEPKFAAGTEVGGDGVNGVNEDEGDGAEFAKWDENGAAESKEERCGGVC